MKCKLGGDDYRNQEGYFEADGLIICCDWDIDCTQCEDERLSLENSILKEIIGKLAYSDEDGGVYDSYSDGMNIADVFTPEQREIILNILKKP